MAIGYGVAAPKPEKGSSRKRRLTLRRKLGEDMRDAVWLRALDKGNGYAFCERCGLGPLLRGPSYILHPCGGHVAHDRGRRVAPEDRFNPEAALLKCRDCHLGGDHSMRFV